jgi:uncharacterized alkaline shock family protein YloU
LSTPATSSSPATTPAATPTPSGTGSAVETSGLNDGGQGTTTIADGVVAKVVGIAAREVPGVYAMGGSAQRVLGSVTQRVGLGDERTQGVSVEVGTREAAADLTVVVEYGESIPRVTGEVRENITRRVEGICGLTVTEINITVVDLHFPGDDAAEQPAAEPRVA